MQTAKVVVLGGSGVATPELAAALRAIPDRKYALEVVLVGRSQAKLETVAGVARILAGDDPLISITTSTNPEEALQGAQLVLNQIRVGGLEARAFDESFPQAIGLPGEETVGPGGFANASRSIPVVLEAMRIVERIAPQAVVLTFSNPSSLVQYAISRYTRITSIGMCDGPLALFHNIAQAVGVEDDRLVIDYVGMHHFGWAVGAWKAGQDVLPAALANAERAAPDVDPAVTRALGVIPGMYLNYFFHPDRMLAKKLGKRTRAEELLELQTDLLGEFEGAVRTGKPPEGLSKRKAKWYQAIIAPVFIDLIEGRGDQRILNIVNRGTVAWLPEEAIIETACRIEDRRIRPLAAPDAPPFVRAMVQRNCAYEMLAVEAIVEHDRAKALKALLLNPMIHTYEQARLTIEQAWSAEHLSG